MGHYVVAHKRCSVPCRMFSAPELKHVKSKFRGQENNITLNILSFAEHGVLSDV